MHDGKPRPRVTSEEQSPGEKWGAPPPPRAKRRSGGGNLSGQQRARNRIQSPPAAVGQPHGGWHMDAVDVALTCR